MNRCGDKTELQLISCLFFVVVFILFFLGGIIVSNKHKFAHFYVAVSLFFRFVWYSDLIRLRSRNQSLIAIMIIILFNCHDLFENEFNFIKFLGFCKPFLAAPIEQ